MNKLANAIGLAYLGFAVYIVTDPWHDQIMEVATETTDKVRQIWSEGKFIIEANVDLALITFGKV